MLRLTYLKDLFMFKGTRAILAGILYCSVSTITLADTGVFFTISEDCQSLDPYPIMLCLDGIAPASCQFYIAHKSRLLISTTTPQYTYSSAGIQILSPLYLPLQCTRIANGYCIFSANDLTPTTIDLKQTSLMSLIC